MAKSRILVLGVTGMLGSAVYRVLSQSDDLEVSGTLRDPAARRFFDDDEASGLIDSVDVLDSTELERVVEIVGPDVIVNCVGLIKQLADADDPLVALPINSLFPHQLFEICRRRAARLVHISTDCVFSGAKGMYTELDTPDARDLYGLSKYIGEVRGQPKAVTLRTSIIGRETNSNYALLDWFLAQKGPVKGYRRAIFSGLPTIELARVVRDFVLPREQINGLYHVSADPIDKFTLLNLVAEVFGKEIEIIPDDDVCIDRSLDSSLFRRDTGYRPRTWREQVVRMYENQYET